MSDKLIKKYLLSMIEIWTFVSLASFRYFTVCICLFFLFHFAFQSFFFTGFYFFLSSSVKDLYILCQFSSYSLKLTE